MDIGKLIGYIKGTFNSFLAKLKKRINNVNGKKVGVGDN
jgi:hypothetical protein